MRRSLIRPSEASAGPRFRSPYRCRDCGERFWVISKRTNYFVGLAAIAIVAGALAWNVVGVPQPRPEPERLKANADILAETIKRAEHDNPVAEHQLSRMYAHGNGVEASQKTAQTWLELAAANGNAEAQYALGQMYRDGLGLSADKAKAYTWFNLAAAHDVAGAAVQRDAVVRALTPGQVLEAQAEARRLSQVADKRSAAVQ